MKQEKKLAKKYAQAIFEITEGDQKLQETYLSEVKDINTVIKATGEIKEIFENPGISKEHKKDLLKKIFTDKINEQIINLLCVLIENQRFNLLLAIQDCLLELINKQKGILVAEIYSTQELDSLVVSKIVETLQHKTLTQGVKEIKINQKIDTSLIGGLKVKINDLVYDGSIRGKLENLKRRLG